MLEKLKKALFKRMIYPTKREYIEIGTLVAIEVNKPRYFGATIGIHKPKYFGIGSIEDYKRKHKQCIIDYNNQKYFVEGILSTSPYIVTRSFTFTNTEQIIIL